MSEDPIIDTRDDYDLDNAEVGRGVKSPRAVVSVSFPREDIEAVGDAAEKAGMKISEFIRTAAMEKASGFQPGTSVAWSGHTMFTLTTQSPVSQPTRGNENQAQGDENLLTVGT